MTKRMAFGALLVVPLFFPFGALGQGTGGTKFRGVSINQSIDEVQKAMAANGFKPEPNSSDKDRLSWNCGSVGFKNGRSTELRLAPCFFRLDSRISARDLAKAMVDNFPLKGMAVGSRQEVDILSYPARRYQVNFYYGRLKTGENVEVIVNDGRYMAQVNYEGSSPEVTVTAGESTGGPIFK